MKTIIISITILLANVTLSQTKKIVTICDTTKKNVSNKLSDNNGGFDLEGTWNGENIPGRKISITFKEYKKTFILIEKDDQLTRGNYEIDINRNPKWIDLHIMKQGGEEIILGIIEFISKNQIAIQFGAATKRPLEFSTKKSDDDENVFLTRQSE